MRWALVIVPLCWCAPDTPYEENVSSNGSPAYEGYNVASEILRDSINFSVNPCEDFYEFACGNWIAKHPIPEDKGGYDHWEVLEDNLQKQMRDMFESNDTFGSKAISDLKVFYKKCMDEDELNRIGAKQMIDYVKSYGVWPALEGDDNWKEENYNLTSLLIHVFLRRGVIGFISLYPGKDDTNFRRLIEFRQGNLLLGKKYYLDEEKNGTYIGMVKKRLTSEMEQFQKDGGLPTNLSKIEEDIDEILNLEMRIAEIMDADVTDNNTYILHLSEMRELLPLVDWSQFFSAVAPPDSQHYFASDPNILVKDIDYMDGINKLLQSTDPRIITNYIFVRFSREWSGEMGEKYEDIEQEYEKAMMGKQQKTRRWKFCTSETMKAMNYATTALYIRKASQETTKEDVMNITVALQKEFREILNTSDWIDYETRLKALNKLDHVVRQIAYPKTILDEKSLDKHYRDLDVRNTDSFSEMVEKVTRWHIEHFFELLTKVVDRFVTFDPTLVRASYSRDTNSLQIAAAILQPPFFHHTFPRALNYGGIGAIVGHEITHGFDNNGRFYDAFGLRDESWDEDANKNYDQRAQCLIDQYGKIEVPETGYKIDGEKTLGENIADHGGVKLAYRHGGEEERIKGLEQFNNDQMFFLGWATIWCGNQTNDSLIKTILTDKHSPDRYRVNLVLANQPEFAAAFDCEVGSTMNPAKHCAVW